MPDHTPDGAGRQSRLDLPPVPAALRDAAVAAWREPVTIDTYLPAAPDRYPAYLDARVYQGSSGRVYPLPFHERIAQHAVPHEWDALHLTNGLVRVMVLPQIGGRIHVLQDLTNGYDVVYRNSVIKPALVGLAGPWASGGIELNWPQHHRPATFLPTDSTIEHESDGAATAWCADHDPFARMAGLHGVRLRPGSTLVELRVRVANRSDDVQTFLWWANLAVAVNEHYQSFFPTDVHHVADHAKRAITAFPRADRPYYGVDYPARVDAEHPDADRIDWYRNIPVPTSYMCLGTQDDFFGGYDHGRRAGVVHWADHRIAPGKKQWTWGDAAFGHAWDDNLTDSDGPYVELMAGVFTDNQPDFSFLLPGETRTFSQYWYPIRETGPVHQATREVAVRLDHDDREGRARVAVATTSARPGLVVTLHAAGLGEVHRAVVDVDPASPYVAQVDVPRGLEETALTLTVTHGARVLLTWTPRPVPADPPEPAPATAPPPPEQVASVDELYVTGLHLEQYRHATRSPEPYWVEALRRDPGHARSHVALGRRRLREGRDAEAAEHLTAAVARLTIRNANPEDGEALYHLGRALDRLGRGHEAREAWGRAAWNRAWRAPALLATARSEAADGLDEAALAHVEEVLHADPDQLQARDLAVVLLRRLGRPAEASAALDEVLTRNPLDAWALELAGAPGTADPTTALDVALELAACGESAAALRVLDRVAHLPHVSGQVAVVPLAHYHRADLLRRSGDGPGAAEAEHAARTADATWCLASRPQDVAMLERTVAACPDDARAWALLGHWLYSVDRWHDAVAAWDRSAALDGTDPVVLRNLAVAAYNVTRDPAAADRWYRRARAIAPDDARLLYEHDQLAARSGVSTDARLAALDAAPALVAARDDLTVEHATLLTAAGRARAALELLAGRRFQPWEGGEGLVLAAWDRASLALARAALADGDPARAIALLTGALDPPRSLGEARHPLVVPVDLLHALADAREAAGDVRGAAQARGRASAAGGPADAAQTDAAPTDAAPGAPDYFATSLPTMLLFHDHPTPPPQVNR